MTESAAHARFIFQSFKNNFSQAFPSPSRASRFSPDFPPSLYPSPRSKTILTQSSLAHFLLLRRKKYHQPIIDRKGVGVSRFENMASKLAINREEVRATYIATGSLNEAALAHGLKPATVRQWAKRHGWETSSNALKLMDRAKEIQRMKQERKHPDAVGVCHASDAIADVFDRQREGFKSAMSQAMHKASAFIGDLPGDAILSESRKVKDIMDVGSKLYGFGEDGTKAGLSVNILNLSADSLTRTAQVVDV